MFKGRSLLFLVIIASFLFLNTEVFAKKDTKKGTQGPRLTQKQGGQRSPANNRMKPAQKRKAEVKHQRKERKELKTDVKDCKGDQECIKNTRKKHRQHQITHKQEKLGEQQADKMKNLEEWKTRKVQECGASQTCVQEAENIYNKRKEQIDKQYSKREKALDKQSEKLNKPAGDANPPASTTPSEPEPAQEEPKDTE